MSSVLGRMNVSRLVSLVGAGLTAIAIFVPWIYGFSPPINKNLDVLTIASPNLFDLALRSDYLYLLAVPAGAALGAAYALIPGLRWKWLEVSLTAMALLLIVVPVFAFGIQYENPTGLYLDGKFVAFTTTLGPGSRVTELSATAYLFALLAAALSD